MKQQEKVEFKATSWQLELLITGGIIFTLYSSTDFFKEVFLLKYPIIDFGHYRVLLFFGLYVLTRALLIGFGANLLLRTVWFAYMAIDYWYPEGIAYDKLNIPSANKEKIKGKAKADERLENLEKWASLSFSFGVLFTMIVVSTLIVCLITCFIFLDIFHWYDLAYNPAFNYGLAAIVFMAQLGVFYSVSIKTPFKVVNKVFSAIGKAYYYFSGTFLYQRELLVLRTNGRKWILVTFGLLYLGLAMLISVNQIGEFYRLGTFEINFLDDRTSYEQPLVRNMNARRYETNLYGNKGFFQGGIQSEIVKDDYLKLFVVHWTWFDPYMERMLDSLDLVKELPEFDNDSLEIVYRRDYNERYQTAVNQLLKVEIDSVPLGKLRWERYTHPKTTEEGYLTFIPIDSLPKGRHFLQMQRQFYNSREKRTRTQNWFSVIFWRE